MIREFGFEERKLFSDGYAANGSVEAILLTHIPGAAKAYRASDHNDRSGTDWWVEVAGRHLSIDCKVREEDYAAKLEPLKADDLALETFSVIEANKPGWTRDPNKRTDYVLWLWLDTNRWCLVSFPQLCAVFSDNWEAWKTQYKVSRQRTGNTNRGYHSECVFVPRSIVWRAIYQRFGGQMPLSRSAA